MPTSTLTSKGQVTIPRSIRQRLGLRRGDRLEFLVTESGEVILRPEETAGWRRLSGALRRYAREQPVSVEEMNDAIREAATEHFRRSRG